MVISRPVYRLRVLARRYITAATSTGIAKSVPKPGAALGGVGVTSGGVRVGIAEVAAVAVLPATGCLITRSLPGTAFPPLSSSFTVRTRRGMDAFAGTVPSTVTTIPISWSVEYERSAPLTNAVDPVAVWRAASLPSSVTWIVHRAPVRSVCIWSECPGANVVEPAGMTTYVAITCCCPPGLSGASGTKETVERTREAATGEKKQGLFPVQRQCGGICWS